MSEREQLTPTEEAFERLRKRLTWLVEDSGSLTPAELSDIQAVRDALNPALSTSVPAGREQLEECEVPGMRVVSTPIPGAPVRQEPSDLLHKPEDLSGWPASWVRSLVVDGASPEGDSYEVPPSERFVISAAQIREMVAAVQQDTTPEREHAPGYLTAEDMADLPDWGSARSLPRRRRVTSREQEPLLYIALNDENEASFQLGGVSLYAYRDITGSIVLMSGSGGSFTPVAEHAVALTKAP